MNSVSERSSIRIALGMGAVFLLIGIFLACGTDHPPAAGAGVDPNIQPQSSCVTPQKGCPCAPDSAPVACGKEVRSDLDVVYCYQGTRYCDPSGVYGDCVEGSIVTKALPTIHTTDLGSPAACTGNVDDTSVRYCNGGRHHRDACITDADCSPGVRRCKGTSTGCRDEDDCDDDKDCHRYPGVCSDGKGCETTADCASGSCNTATPGSGVCVTYDGVCDDTHGDACRDGDCPSCVHGSFGRCVGGKRRGKVCHRDNQCRGGYCSRGLPDGGGTQLDPCDPYCNVTSDTPVGFDAGPDFALRDGGLVVPGCGDGVVQNIEECDDGNKTDGDGCSSDCTVEVGYSCPPAGGACTLSTNCGNGTPDTGEECDDGNKRPYDGCSPSCRVEIFCPPANYGTAAGCEPRCGDGVVSPGEGCDDGNKRAGDGCSPTCTVESGWTCTTVTSELPDKLDVPVIYRDMKGCNPPPGVAGGPTTLPANTHPDFDCNSSFWTGAVSTGMVNTMLASDGEPTLAATKGRVTSAASFLTWYHDDANFHKVIYDQITLPRVGMTTTYRYTNGNFFPLDGRGWGNIPGYTHNFHFTSELRFPFTYVSAGPAPTFDFTGDDDVWVFINGKLAVDIGGQHGPQNGNITLNAAQAADFGLVNGGNYEIAVFQAERHVTGSSYTLSLGGFVRARSKCENPKTNTVVRDFEAVCPPGSTGVWTLFQWKAAVPTSPQAKITYRAATSEDTATLPNSPTAPGTVAIGVATPANSPATGPVNWQYEKDGVGDPVFVATHLKNDLVPSQTSKRYLRVFMTFDVDDASGASPRLDEWQQLFSCQPNE